MDRTATRISSEASPRPSSEDDVFDTSYDVVVIGGGAAGLSGALALGRARRAVLVLDAGAPRNAPAGHVHNYLSSEGVAPSSLLATGRAEVAEYGVRVVQGTATAARRLEGGRAESSDASEGGRFRVELAGGRSVGARRLLVATGLVDELPAVPGVAERWGRDVLHCPYCHGWEVRDQVIGILGTGPMAVHQAQLFRQWSADVVLFLHEAPALSEEQAEQLAARGVRVVEGQVAALEVEGDRLAGVRLRSGEVIPRQAVVVAPRFVARPEVLGALGLETTERELGGHLLATFVPVDATGATAMPGVWAAGNVADPFGQVIAAAADGLKAGAAINADLIAEETDRAVAARRARAAPAPEPVPA